MARISGLRVSGTYCLQQADVSPYVLECTRHSDSTISSSVRDDTPIVSTYMYPRHIVEILVEGGGRGIWIKITVQICSMKEQYGVNVCVCVCPCGKGREILLHTMCQAG